MKKWLIPAAVLAAVAIFSRLPHPARDIAYLKPVRVVYIHMEGRTFHIETDTGDSGAAGDLTEACADLRTKADGEIFALLRPDCRVTFTDMPPDLEKAAAYLSQHPPELTLARLRDA